MKTGLDVGAVVGVQLGYRSPVYFETGLSYIEKGGEGSYNGSKFTYNLDYLEMPLVLKYIHNFDRNFSIQPFFGGYLSAGVGGKIKDYHLRESYSAFGDGMDQFKRFDGGLRMGVGIQYDLFYADLTYDLGLANIGQDDFDDTKNSAVMLNIGVNF